MNKYELSPDEVAFKIEEKMLEELDVDISEEFIIGQPRALKALTMGIDIAAKGYNIFVSGQTGTGRHTAIRRILEQHAPNSRSTQDIAIVYNFQTPDNPTVLYFPPGKAVQFKKALHDVVENLKKSIQSRFNSESFKRKRDGIIEETEREENHSLAEFEQELAKEDFRMIQIEEEDVQTTDIVPVLNGEPADFDALQQLVTNGSMSDQEWHDRREKYYYYVDKMKQLFTNLRDKRMKAESKIGQLQRKTVTKDISLEVSLIMEKFKGKKIASYLGEIEQDIKNHLFLFMLDNEEDEELQTSRDRELIRYGVNVLLDSGLRKKAAILLEAHPDYQSLFGSIETIQEKNGETRSNFMMIRAGSLIRATGGFLILRAEDILAEEESWVSLKRALLDGKTEIRNPQTPFGPTIHPIKPEPINIDVKVIIIGNEHYYDALFAQDEDFQKLFKIPAEFDSTMNRDNQTIREYMGFVRRIAKKEKLLMPNYSGIAAILEYGIRLAEFKDKLSTRFSLIADIIRESSYWAKRDGDPAISRKSVEQAVAERSYLYNLPEEKIDEQILSGELLISVKGDAVGRINGLAVIDRGYYSFARPLLITARTAPGNEGLINIERESGLSGEIHDKGMYIIEGFLQTRYSRDFPLSIRASIAFEQSYIEIDGDSASSTEVYALLSAIAELPLRQEIAVTGSVNQMGEIQPVGGVSEKIEGFYTVCTKLGLTGTQGVIIPKLNLNNLILSQKVQKAVSEGMFHIYSIDTVDEGMEILTGLKAGKRDRKSGFPKQSINGKIEKRLKEMASQVKDFGGG